MPKAAQERVIDTPAPAGGLTFVSSAIGGSVPGGGIGVTDHGALTGLGDDDHPQYLLAATFTAHAANADAHHARLHDLFSASDHTASGAALEVVGFTALNTLGKLTPSADVGTTPAAALLKSTAGGGLTLGALGVKGSTTIYSAGTVGTDNYASQVTGWRIDYAGGADFRYLFVDEMHAKSFVADLEQALAGGQVIWKSVAVLYSNFVLPAAGADGYFYVRDLPSAPGMAVFVNGDYVRFRQFSRSAGSLTIGDAWGTVQLNTAYGVNGYDAATKTQGWRFFRSAGADGGTASGTIYADSLVLDYGTANSGGYEVNAADGAYGANSPYVRFETWATHPRARTVAAQLGKLSGLTGIGQTGEYGLYVKGKNAGDYLLASPVQGVNLVAAAGAVSITENGLSMDIPANSVDSKKAVTWKSGATVAARIGAYTSGGASLISMQADGTGTSFATLDSNKIFNVNNAFIVSGTTYAMLDTMNLGIGLQYGVNTPQARLHVHGDSPSIRLSSDGANETITLSYYDNNATLKGRLLYAGGNAEGNRYFGFVNDGGDYLGFLHGGAVRLRVDSTGFGVGANFAPSHELHVRGGSTVVGMIEGTSTSFGPSLRINSSGASGRNYGWRSSQASDTGGAGKFQIVDYTASAVRWQMDSSGNVSQTGNLAVSGAVTGILIPRNYVPGTDDDQSGTVGEITWGYDGSNYHLYLKSSGGSVNSWKRVIMAGW